MSDRLKGKRAFVTAAAAGIGRACALAFAREGATVFATDIDEKGLAALPRKASAEVARLDVRDSAAVAAMAKRVGKVDILLNAAGFVHHGSVLECSDADWDFSFDLNVKSMHRTIRAFLPGMLEARPRLDRQHLLGRRRVQGRAEPLRLRRDQGRGRGTDPRGRGRLHHQGHPLQLHLPRHHRDAVDARPRRRRRSAGPRDVRQPRQPMGRLGTAEEIASLAVYLASDESAFTTGVAHIIDGGWTLYFHATKEIS